MIELHGAGLDSVLVSGDRSGGRWHGSRTARRMAVRALKYAVHVQDEAGLLDVVCHLDL